eukprot:12451800-Ditylum_brightwellii.AAC.1
MEQNQKLSLETDKALILKTFENKLRTLFGRLITEGVTTKMVMSAKDTWLPGMKSYSQWETPSWLGGMKVVLQQQLGTVDRQLRESIRMNLNRHLKARAVAVSCLETSLGFLGMVNNFISNTYRDLESSGFPADITWQLVSKLIYKVFAGDLDKVQSFMRISHVTHDHLTLASRCIWAVFKTNKVMKTFQLQGLANHSSVLVTHIFFLVANSEIGRAEKLEEELKSMKETIKALTSNIKAAKIQSASAVTKADKALAAKKKD